MSASAVDRLEFRGARLGYARVSDGSLILLRVAVVDVRVRGETSPFGVEFDVTVTVGTSVYPSEEAQREADGKQIAEPSKVPGEGWVPVGIVERSPAYEEIVYRDEKVGRYLVRVEVEPIMASKNTLYRVPPGVPWYLVRWVPKVTWSKIVDEGAAGRGGG